MSCSCFECVHGRKQQRGQIEDALIGSRPMIRKKTPKQLHDQALRVLRRENANAALGRAIGRMGSP